MKDELCGSLWQILVQYSVPSIFRYWNQGHFQDFQQLWYSNGHFYNSSIIVSKPLGILDTDGNNNNNNNNNNNVLTRTEAHTHSLRECKPLSAELAFNSFNLSSASVNIFRLLLNQAVYTTSRVVFHDFPWPYRACRTSSLITWSMFIVTEHCTNYYVIMYLTQRFTNSTKYRMWPKFFTVW